MIFVDGLQLENAREPDFVFTTKSTKRITAEEILRTNFKLKDTITIPIGEKDYVFVVEHIRLLGNNNEKVYFVAKDIVAKSSMARKQINAVLDIIEASIPHEIVDVMDTIEHKINDYTLARKINILSRANLQNGNGDEDFGYDDIPFEGLQAQVERCKGSYGDSCRWGLLDLWEGFSTDSYPKYSIIVSSSGEITVNDMTHEHGIVPCFSIITRWKI